MHLLLPADYPEERAAALVRRHRGLLLLRYTHAEPRPRAGRVALAAARRWAPWRGYDALRARIEALWPAQPHFTVSAPGGGYEPLTAPLPGVEILYVPWHLDTPALRTLLPWLPGLRWIHSSMTGVDHILPALPAGHTIALSSSSGLHSRRMAEFALAILLGARKRLLEHRALQNAARWGEPPSVDLAGKLLLVVGAGAIGRAVATQARIFGMRVEGVSRSGAADPHFDRSWPIERLDELLPRADHLLLSAPLTPATHHLLDAHRLALLPSGAVVVNLGRAELIEEAALLAELEAGRPALVALEDSRHLPRRHPFHHLPGVLLTHHSAWSGEGATAAIQQRFEDNLSQWLAAGGSDAGAAASAAANAALAGRIDPRRGY